MLFYIVILCLCNNGWSFGTSPTSISNGDVNSLTKHILQLEQSLSNMRSEAQTKDQKYAAVMSSVLSKLTTTTDELSIVRSDLKTVKAQLKSTQDQLKMATDVVESNITYCISELEAMQHGRKSIQEDVKNLTVELHDSESVISLLKFDVTRLQRDVMTVENTSKRIDQSLVQLTDQDVAFQVKGVNHTAVTTLTFDKVVHNRGKAYNNTTGMFTAPLPGTYLFWANILFSKLGSWGDCWVYIKQGVHVLAKGFVRLQDEHASSVDYRVASTMIVTHLDTGNQIYFSIHQSCTLNTLNGAGISTYGGALLNVG